MKISFRITILVLLTVATYYFVYIFVFFLPFLMFHGSLFHWIRVSASLVCAVAIDSCFWKYTSPATLAAPRNSDFGDLPKRMFQGALITGGIGFVAGYFGPIIFEQGANQGPLLGIFVTGPLGTVLGAVGGAIYWAIRKYAK